MEHQSYAIIVKIARRVGNEIIRCEVAVSYNSGENLGELFKRCEAICGESLNQYDELIIKKQY